MPLKARQYTTKCTKLDKLTQISLKKYTMPSIALSKITGFFLYLWHYSRCILFWTLVTI